MCLDRSLVSRNRGGEGGGGLDCRSMITRWVGRDEAIAAAEQKPSAFMMTDDIRAKFVFSGLVNSRSPYKI